MEVGRTGWVTGRTPERRRTRFGRPGGAARRAAHAHDVAQVPAQARARGGPFRSSELHRATGIDPWFLDQLPEILELERWFSGPAVPRCGLGAAAMKREGFADAQLAALRGRGRGRHTLAALGAWGIRPTYNVVDTCAGEFPAATPYYYSSYESEDESEVPTDRRARSSSWAAGRTGSGRGSSSTTAACRRCWRSGRRASRRSW